MHVLEVRQWKLRTNFALSPLLPSLASNTKCSPSLYPSTKKVWFCSSIMLFSVPSPVVDPEFSKGGGGGGGGHKIMDACCL